MIADCSSLLGSYWQVIKRSQVVSGCVSVNHRNMLVSGPHGHYSHHHSATYLTFLAGEIITGCVNCSAAGVDNDHDIVNLSNLSYYELLKDENLVTPNGCKKLVML